MNDVVKYTALKSIPWFNWDEWDLVKINLFSYIEKLQLYAIEIINSWRNRGRLPHAVESSAVLIEIILRDNQRKKEAVDHKPGLSSRSNIELRNLYSIAIIRAVNGLVDPSQKGIYAQSIYNIANTIGLPSWLVELRHESTHDKLPSLSILRLGAKEILDWLFKNYWMPQQEYIHELLVMCSTQVEKTQSYSKSKSNVSSTTFVTDILIPMMIESTVSSQYYLDDASKQDDLDTFLNDKATGSFSIWFHVIDEFSLLFPCFKNQLIFRYINFAFDLIENHYKGRIQSNINDIDLTVKIRWSVIHAIIVLEHFQKSFTTGFNDDFLCKDICACSVYSRLNSVEKLIQCDSVVVDIFTKLSNLFLISFPNSNEKNVDDSSVAGDLDLRRVKRQKINTSRQIQSVSLPAWPIGLLPGHFNPGNLYMIEELKNEE